MLRLTANKTKLYKLVAEYVKDLPPMRSGTTFVKYPRTKDCALEWVTQEWDRASAYLSACMGKPLLSILVRDGDTGKIKKRDIHRLDLQGLRERGMVEEFTTAVEKRRAERERTEPV